MPHRLALSGVEKSSLIAFGPWATAAAQGILPSVRPSEPPSQLTCAPHSTIRPAPLLPPPSPSCVSIHVSQALCAVQRSGLAALPRAERRARDRGGRAGRDDVHAGWCPSLLVRTRTPCNNPIASRPPAAVVNTHTASWCCPAVFSVSEATQRGRYRVRLAGRGRPVDLHSEWATKLSDCRIAVQWAHLHEVSFSRCSQKLLQVLEPTALWAAGSARPLPADRRRARGCTARQWHRRAFSQRWLGTFGHPVPTDHSGPVRRPGTPRSSSSSAPQHGSDGRMP